MAKKIFVKDTKQKLPIQRQLFFAVQALTNGDILA
jgi:hypothetical protein